MKSLLEVTMHKAKLERERAMAQDEDNFVEAHILKVEIAKTEKLISTWGVKENTIYRIM